jgi:putative heme-binding domain-containing protein
MLKAWPDFGAKSKTAALEALLARDDRALALLNAMSDAQGPKPSDLSAAQVQALAKHKNEQIVALAKTALASVIPPSRESVVATFKPALNLIGDVASGATHYQSRCLACHVADGQGMPVGPDLVTVKTKGREGILSAILEPHKEVASQFIAYTVNTKDGQTVSGIVTQDDASGMTLKMMGGAEVTLQRANIQGSSSTGQSLMPEGLETGMTPQDMADLLAYIEGLK